MISYSIIQLKVTCSSKQKRRSRIIVYFEPVSCENHKHALTPCSVIVSPSIHHLVLYCSSSRSICCYNSVYVSCLANWCHVTFSINAKVERGLNGWSCMPGGASQKSQGVDRVWQTKVHGSAITLLSNSNWCSCARTHASNCSSSLIRSRSSLYLVVSASLSCIKYCYCPCKSVLNPCLVHPMLSFYTFCAFPCPGHLIAG